MDTSSIIETFNPDIWKKEVPNILRKEGIKVFEKWLNTHHDQADAFVKTFLACYEWFSPHQPKNIWLYCSPHYVPRIYSRVNQSGDPLRIKLLLDDYIRLRNKEIEEKSIL